MDKENHWGKDGPGKDVELHLNKSMIGSLMYLTASRPDIMFAVCACARHKVTPKECHLHAVKRIFRYLNGHPKLGLWYPKESPFDLVVYSDSDYGGATQDRKSTTGEYVAAASGCGQVLWIQNQMLDYGIETTDQETKIIATVDGKSQTISESSLRRHLKLNDEEGISSLPDAELFENLSLMGYIILPNQSLDARQDRENIAKTSAMPYESSPRVPSLDADEGSMQQRIHELMELCTSLQRQQSQMANKIKDQDLEISGLKERVKSLEDKERSREEPFHKDAPITWGIIDIGEELGAEKSIEKGSNDTEEMINVLSSMEAANILSSGGAAVSVSPADVFSTAGVSTVSGSFPIVSAIFTTASVVTPYTRRSRGIRIRSSQPMRIPIIRAKDKENEKVIETEVPRKRKLQEQIDAQVAREMEEEFARENQRLSEQLARDAEIARIHTKEELKMMIEGLDRSNEVIAKHLSEYEQAEAELSVGEKIELIHELVKYQDHRAKILKYQAQQSKPLSKKEQREFYLSVLRSHAGWKTKHFRGMTLEQIKEKFILVWK
nr:hypothetical protein [Tanacetum cinerariifolium]